MAAIEKTDTFAAIQRDEDRTMGGKKDAMDEVQFRRAHRTGKAVMEPRSAGFLSMSASQ